MFHSINYKYSYWVQGKKRMKSKKDLIIMIRIWQI